MQVYEVSITKVETTERLISKYTKKWLGVSTVHHKSEYTTHISADI